MFSYIDYEENSKKKPNWLKRPAEMTPEEKYEKYLVNNAWGMRRKWERCEKIVAEHLEELGVNYQRQVPLLVAPMKGYIMDFLIYIDDKPCDIEVDGSGHGARDIPRDKAFATLGYKVIRIKNEEVKSGDFSAIDNALFPFRNEVAD